MKRECNIVRDLLPLYVENMVSDETREFVEAHLSKCPECNKIYLNMTDKDEGKIVDEEARERILPLRVVKKKLLRKKIVTSLVAAVLAIALLIGGGAIVYNIVDEENKKAEIDLGTSQNYSLEDRKAAVDMILNEIIYPLGFGYDVISIRFAGDAECVQYYLDEADRPLSDDWLGWLGYILDGKYVHWKESDYMVFRVALKTPAWGDARGFEPDTFYGNIKVVFKRTEDRSGWLVSYIDLAV